MFSKGLAAFLIGSIPIAMGQTVANAHFHHLHLNSTDPEAAINFYTSKFDAEKVKFGGVIDDLWTQKSWILFYKVDAAPQAERTSTVWHFGWGAEDMPAAYEKQVAAGTKFHTPLTDISDIGGNPNARPGSFYYAYVLGPDGALIELNTANHHHFGHIHLLSADPLAAAGWYEKHFGVKARKQPEKRMYRNVQIAPSASFNMDNVNFIIFPLEYAKTEGWPEWTNRTEFDSTKGHVVDHIAISVDNLDDARAKLTSAGVKGVTASASFLDGKMKYAWIEGPDKMMIELVEGQAVKP